MSFRIAINGLGRIGRCVLRAYCESDYPELEIVALNELADLPTLAHLTRYDSTHGRFPGTISVENKQLLIDQRVLSVSHIQALEHLPWKELDIDLVMECTGTFTSRQLATVHLEQGAGKVLFSQPAEADVDATIVYGVNHDELLPEHRIISAASCTTNCIVPVIRVLDQAFGIENGIITTIHSAMNDQPVLDAYHHTDLRKTRSAFQSIIPVDTGLAAGIERILPELKGRFSAQALRVPTVNVSAMDLTLQVKNKVDTALVNQAIAEGAAAMLPNVLAYTDEPLASCDFNHDIRSAIVDRSQTRVSGGHLLKLIIWFDNEWAYANRMLDVAKLLSAFK